MNKRTVIIGLLAIVFVLGSGPFLLAAQEDSALYERIMTWVNEMIEGHNTDSEAHPGHCDCEPSATQIPYDNSQSGLAASNVQAAIDELTATVFPAAGDDLVGKWKYVSFALENGYFQDRTSVDDYVHFLPTGVFRAEISPSIDCGAGAGTWLPTCSDGHLSYGGYWERDPDTGILVMATSPLYNQGTFTWETTLTENHLQLTGKCWGAHPDWDCYLDFDRVPQ